MDSVVHFEIPVEELSRAKTFYKKTFGWNANDWPKMDYTTLETAETDKKTRMIKRAGAINGGMMKKSQKIKSPVITIAVKDMDKALKNVKANGGKLHVDKIKIGDMGYAAYIKDTEGNIIGLFEPKMM